MKDESAFGRRVPSDFKHVEKYPYGAVAPTAPAKVERTLSLPRYRSVYDQQREGACVGFASSWMMSMLNRRLYDARWLWNEAKEIDEWPDTNPGDNSGTSVRAAMDVLRKVGHCRIYREKARPPHLAEGILRNRWARTVDEIRTSIDRGAPVVLGVNWYENFDSPERSNGDYWIGRGDLGRIRAGHAVCVYGASDKRQAVRIVNNWGERYPLVLMPYSTVERLLQEDGEAALVTDRKEPEKR